MCHGAGFGNGNDVTAADSPGQRNRGCGASVCCGNTAKNGITQQAGAKTAERRIGHHRHAVLLAPWQEVAFNAAVAEIVIDLIGRAAIALWNLDQSFHLGDCKVRYPPGTNPASCTETFEPCYDLGKFGVRSWRVQQIEIEMISTEPGEACLTSACHSISRGVTGFHLGHDEGAVTLAGNHA